MATTATTNARATSAAVTAGTDENDGGRIEAATATTITASMQATLTTRTTATIRTAAGTVTSMTTIVTIKTTVNATPKLKRATSASMGPMPH